MSAGKRQVPADHSDTKLTVYYDRSCPICRTEVEALDRDADGWTLRDCSAMQAADEVARRDGISVAAMMSAMHVRDRDGTWLTGVDAIARLYHDAGRHRVARLLRWRRLRPIWDVCYTAFARHRQALSRTGVQFLLGVALRHGRRSRRSG